MAPETFADIDLDPFASYFSGWDPNTLSKILTTASPKATKVTYNFCEKLVGVFSGAESARDEGWDGQIAGWAADRVSENVGHERRCEEVW